MTTEIPKTWETKSRPNETAKIPYAYKASDEDPLVLVPDPEIVPIVEQAMDYLDEGHSLFLSLNRRWTIWMRDIPTGM